MEKFFKISLAISLLLAVFFALSFYYPDVGFWKKEDGGAWKNGAETEEIRQPYLESDGMAAFVPEENFEDELRPPLDRVAERVSKKPFGKFVTPQNSPVSPERFSGYHTAIDLEVFPEELEAEVKVPVKAICSGKLLSKRTASGYGGLAVQECEIGNQAVTVVYGHLKLSSISKNIGDEIGVGEEIGVLGNGYSVETDGERKHLHLGIRKGSDINILGYAQNEAQLSGWIDPCLYFCGQERE
ncbi:MAG: hypothetical protein UY41_C0011G0034 [Candidatus Moranbacteria bacterium GW2011_GWE1_49_15]|nr:MAG: hypothetical protein UX75_C0016G0014 [Candidatus Moranbacteria bacterium GW2011_GWE2_47_10]KKW06977.1 MAG: hypothetical protein UY41_C0011G0034 [Candidatus Moranbacteria bacterium GW2011_GWE1_49_15]HBP01379.1 hypothetical protein [Candidatus Moranbacteria bacterium]